jgi:hypothetical protein
LKNGFAATARWWQPFEPARCPSDVKHYVALGSIAVLAVACSQSPNVRSTAVTSSRGAAGPPISSSAPAASAKTCAVDDVALDFYGGGGATGNDFGTIRIRDIASSPCTLRGPIVVTGLDQRGRAVTHALSYPVARSLVLSRRARPVPVEGVAPPWERVADLMMDASYRDDPASPDGLCRAHRVVPDSWKLSFGGGTKRARNASYDPRNPTNEFASLVTCYGEINTPATVRLDD